MKKICIVAILCFVLLVSACLYACSGKQMTIKFDPNYEGAQIIEVVVPKGELGVVPNATREGYVFEGWFSDKEGTKSVGLTVGGSVVASNNTYYGKWKAVEGGDAQPQASDEQGNHGGTSQGGDNTGNTDNQSGTEQGNGQSTVTMTASYQKARAEFEAVTGVQLPAIADLEVSEYPYEEGDTSYCLDITSGAGLSYATFEAIKAYLDTALSGWTITGPSVDGEYTNVNYNGVAGWIGLTWDSTNAAVYVNASMGASTPTVTLSSISATYQGTVKAGAAFDTAKIIVSATYSDGSRKDVTNYVLACDYAATNGQNEVSVRYIEGDVSKECVMTYQLYSQTIVSAMDNNIYFTNNQGWAAVCAYAWTGDGESAVSNADWPGEACAYVATNEYGQDVYAYDLTGKSFEKIIFNNNNQGEQTVDITLGDSTNGYYTTDKQDGKYNVSPYQDKYVRTGDITTYEFTGLGAWAMDGKKKVYIYTPVGYDPTDVATKYRVLYMFDGQNLFDGLSLDNGSATRWGVNTTLAKAGVDCIVVGIDNGEDKYDAAGHWRDKQLTMDEATFGPLSALTTAGGKDETANYQHGTLDALGDFIRNTLIPYINDHYNVYTGREDTYIAGSSSGGLAAFYLGLRDSDLYGAVGAFSPATGLFDLSTWQTWLSGDSQKAARAYPQSMFIYCGYGQGSDDLENALYDYGDTAGVSKLEDLLLSCGYQTYGSIGKLFTTGAVHNEGAWRLAFAEFVNFVY